MLTSNLQIRAPAPGSAACAARLSAIGRRHGSGRKLLVFLVLSGGFECLLHGWLANLPGSFFPLFFRRVQADELIEQFVATQRPQLAQETLPPGLSELYLALMAQIPEGRPSKATLQVSGASRKQASFPPLSIMSPLFVLLHAQDCLRNLVVPAAGPSRSTPSPPPMATSPAAGRTPSPPADDSDPWSSAPRGAEDSGDMDWEPAQGPAESPPDPSNDPPPDDPSADMGWD